MSVAQTCPWVSLSTDIGDGDTGVARPEPSRAEESRGVGFSQKAWGRIRKHSPSAIWTLCASPPSKGRGPGGREELKSLELIEVPAAGQEELLALCPPEQGVEELSTSGGANLLSPALHFGRQTTKGDAFPKPALQPPRPTKKEKNKSLGEDFGRSILELGKAEPSGHRGSAPAGRAAPRP